MIRYREFWGADKRALLLKTLECEGDFDSHYEQVQPSADNRFSFRLSKTEVNYADWPTVVELAEEEPISGLQEMRRGALMAHEREALQDRMIRYFNTEVDWSTFAADGTALSRNAGGFDPVSTRARLQSSEAFDEGQLKRYALYPLDNRWCYYSSVPLLWNRPRPELVSQRADEEPFSSSAALRSVPKKADQDFSRAPCPIIKCCGRTPLLFHSGSAQRPPKYLLSDRAGQHL